VPAHHRRDGTVAGGHLLERKRVGHVVEPGAVPLGRDGHPHESELAQRLYGRARESGGAIPLGRMRRELTARELARRIARHALFFAQKHGESCTGRADARLKGPNDSRVDPCSCQGRVSTVSRNVEAGYAEKL